MKKTVIIRGGGAHSLHNSQNDALLKSLEPSLWNSALGRRAFLKKTGAATVGTAIVLHGFRSELLASGSSGIWYIEALPDQGSLFNWTNYGLAGPMGAFSYNIEMVNTDGITNAPYGMVSSTLRLRSESFRWTPFGDLDGYPGCLASMGLGGLSGAVMDGMIGNNAGNPGIGSALGSPNLLSGDTGWLHADDEPTEGYGWNRHFYRWVIENPVVNVTGWGTGFVLRDISFNVTMYRTKIFYLVTPPASVPAGTTGNVVQTTSITHSQSLNANLS